MSKLRSSLEYEQRSDPRKAIEAKQADIARDTAAAEKLQAQADAAAQANAAFAAEVEGLNK